MKRRPRGLLRTHAASLIGIVVLSVLQLGASADEVHRLAATGDVDRLTALVDADPALVDAVDECGMSPLHWAAFLGHKAAVDLLLVRGADPNRCAAEGKPFAQAGYVDAAAVPEVVAAVWGRLRVERAEGLTPLHFAGYCGSTGIVRSLLEAGAQVNVKAGKGGFTPLHLAATCGSRPARILGLLIREGADVGARDTNGATPLHWAALAGRLEAVEALLSHGADADAMDNHLATPFQYARLMSRGDVMHALRAAGAQVRIREASAWSLDYFRDHVRLGLWAEPDYVTGEVLIELEVSSSGSLSVWAPLAPEDFQILADGQRQPSTVFYSSVMAASPIHPDAPRRSCWSKSEDDVKAWLGPGRHEMHFELGPVASNALVIDVPDEGAITYRPRLADLSWQNERPGAKKREGETALHKAAWAGEIELVRKLLASGDAVDARNSLGETALHYAVMRGFEEVARELIAASADVRAAARGGWTPLHQAALDGDAEMAGLLLAAGADAEATDGRGRAPLDVALRWRRKEVADLLLDRTTKRDVFVASALGDMETVKRLLDQEPALVAARYAAGTGAQTNPLHFAVIWGREGAVELLLDKGASPRAASASEDPPLSIAAERGDAAIARMLIRSGAPVDDRGPNWPSALFAAARLGHPDVVELLLQNGAGQALRNWLQRTPLHVAAENGDARTARLLIAAGADVNARARNAQTALDIAVSGGHVEFVRALLEAGADPNATNAQGDTALRLAAWWGRADIAELLLSAGARPNTMDSRGCTPLDAAAERGHAEVAALLRQHGAEE